jgi:NADPH2:quinone reductase
VHSVGISFPDLLLSKGEYQLKPEPPFTLGVDFAGVVLDPGAAESSGFTVGQRVCGVAPYGGAAEQVANPVVHTFALPDSVSYDAGAALPMNYLTAQFALRHRGDLREGETVLVHGAAGGVGTATIQVAKGYGARTIAVVSTEEKGEVARRAGADEVVVWTGSTGGGGFKDEVRDLTGGRGVDVVLDVVGGDAFTDSLRCLAEDGRLLVVGFAAGQGIPEVKVNRLLLNNIDVRGVGWGAYAMARPGFMQRQWIELAPMLESGVVDPPIGETYELDGFGRALADMEQRRTLGKSVVRVR